MKATRRSLLSAASLAAAGGALGSPAIGQTREIKVLTVRATQFAAHAKRLPEFERRSGIKVTYTEVPFTQMREKLTAEIVANSADFDVVSVLDTWVPASAGFLEPLDGQIRGRGIDLARYPEAFLNAARVGDTVRGLPIRGHVQLMFYRKDLIEQVGMRPPGTWDEAVAVSRAVQERNPGTAGMAMYYGKNNGQNQMVWYNFLWQNGADLFDAQNRPVFNSESGLKATQDYLDLLLRHRVTPAGSASFNETDAVNSVMQGNSAMIPVWWWVVSRFSERGSAVRPNQIGYSPLPTYAGAPRTSYANTWIYAINRNSRSKEAALDYLAWLTDPAIERSVLVDPTENEVVAVQWQNLRDPEVNARWNNLQMLGAEALQSPRVIRFFPQFPQVTDVLDNAISGLAAGQGNVPQTMNAAAEQIARITARRGR